MILRRLVESLAALPERRHLDEVRAFLAAHPIDGAKQATAQTLERMQMDADLRDRILGPVGAWLARPRQARSAGGRGAPGRPPRGGADGRGGLLRRPAADPARPTPAPPPAARRPRARRRLPATAVDAAALATPTVAAGAPTPRPTPPARDAHAARSRRAPASDAAAERPTPRRHAPNATDRSPRRRRAPPPAAAAAADKNGEKQSDKDLAREAWRRNLPDVSVDGPRATLLIPLKGSSRGGDLPRDQPSARRGRQAPPGGLDDHHAALPGRARRVPAGPDQPGRKGRQAGGRHRAQDQPHRSPGPRRSRSRTTTSA